VTVFLTYSERSDRPLGHISINIHCLQSSLSSLLPSSWLCLSDFFAWLCYQGSLKQRMVTFPLPSPIYCSFTIINSHREWQNFNVLATLGRGVLRYGFF